MNILLQKLDPKNFPASLVLLYGSDVAPRCLPLKRDEIAYLEQCRKRDPASLVLFNRLPNKLFVQNFDTDLPAAEALECLRRSAAEIQLILSNDKSARIAVSGFGIIPEEMIAFLEGLHMANYRFDKYKNNKVSLLNEVVVDNAIVDKNDLEENLRLWKRIDLCRDWVNEPVMYLNAPKFADILMAEAEKLSNVKCTVLGQKKIESLKMGGLLAVNRGSDDEARFVLLEYKPADRVNKKPIALPLRRQLQYALDFRHSQRILAHEQHRARNLLQFWGHVHAWRLHD